MAEKKKSSLISHGIAAQNRKARHDFAIEDTYEAGLVLQGTEVKSLREGRASLVDGFVDIDRGEAWLHNVHIPEYTQGTWTNHAARRKRKLLLNRAEIDKIERRVNEREGAMADLLATHPPIADRIARVEAMAYKA